MTQQPTPAVPADRRDRPESLTPITEDGVLTFFEGLAAIETALVYAAPARVAVAITPSLAELLRQFCGSDPRYRRVMANTFVLDHPVLRSAPRAPGW